MCPHPAMYVFTYCSVCVLELLYTCHHTTTPETATRTALYLLTFHLTFERTHILAGSFIKITTTSTTILLSLSLSLLPPPPLLAGSSINITTVTNITTTTNVTTNIRASSQRGNPRHTVTMLPFSTLSGVTLRSKTYT